MHGEAEAENDSYIPTQGVQQVCSLQVCLSLLMSCKENMLVASLICSVFGEWFSSTSTNQSGFLWLRKGHFLLDRFHRLERNSALSNVVFAPVHQGAP